MGLPTAYLVTAKNLGPIIDALLSAKAPDRLSGSFIKTLGFTSSNDVLYVKLFKELGLIDSTGAPSERYFRFLDQSETKRVLAEAIEEAYSDLFALNKKAYELDEAEVKNKLRTLTQGQREAHIINFMAKTFKALADYADWSKPKGQGAKPVEEVKPVVNVDKEVLPDKTHDRHPNKPSLHYNIEIHLPETRDAAVYDAIFRSLKEHLF